MGQVLQVLVMLLQAHACGVGAVAINGADPQPAIVCPVTLDEDGHLVGLPGMPKQGAPT